MTNTLVAKPQKAPLGFWPFLAQKTAKTVNRERCVNATQLDKNQSYSQQCIPNNAVTH